MRLFLSCILFTILLVSCIENEKKNGTPAQKEPAEMLAHMEDPSGDNSQLPRLFSNGKELYFSWVSQKDSLDVLNYSIYSNNKWSNTTEVISGNNWFTNWADFPAIAENNGNILTSFLQKSADGTYTYDVKLNLYNTKTKTWKKDFILNDDGTQSEHGFVSMRPYAGNSFMISWLDGRETVGKGHGGGQMTLRGALVFEDGTIDYDTLLDERVCDCCNTATAIGLDDQILVAYRDRSEEEIRDISLVDWTKEKGWSQPRSIGNDQWKIAGCPVNGPAMDSFEGSVAITWFTAASEEGAVNVSFSADSGENFGDTFRIDAGNATGRIDLVMLSETSAAILWMEPQGEEEVIQLVKVSSNGQIGPPITVSKTSPERASGFPQLEKLGENLIIAWTSLGENTVPSIQMAQISIEQL